MPRAIIRSRHVSVEIGRSTWQGPAEEAPRLAHITQDDLVSALEQIEMLTATGTELDPETAMHVHLIAGIGRATHDRWTPLYAHPPERGGDVQEARSCEAGLTVEQVQKAWTAERDRLTKKTIGWKCFAQGKLISDLQIEIAALTPAPQPSETVVEAARELLDGASTTYRAGHGRKDGIEADDGEMCYIVHSDLMHALEAALRALSGRIDAS